MLTEKVPENHQSLRALLLHAFALKKNTKQTAAQGCVENKEIALQRNMSLTLEESLTKIKEEYRREQLHVYNLSDDISSILLQECVETVADAPVI